ncbi:hypothetical protein PIB30_024061 [Stylosanthes scabra]|uniref:PGG domain-containing protein n=1 Tax=Stylosanthes scabra TaxID=79078 RepID=A0ABU6S9N9_9FABA|nr:hypothetical protein [Stylosanthes scabra]
MKRASFSPSPFGETPLHTAAVLGDLELCEILLSKEPSLATQVDSQQGHSPLHLASAEGHTKVVKALVMANSDTCLIQDKHGNLPLHLAASRGHVGTVQELIRFKPCSLREMVDDGSVLHLCLRFNHLEAFKFIVESVHGAKQLLYAIDKDGNTLLHLAVSLRQIKIIRYLLLLPEIRTVAKAMNSKGLTALEVLDHCPRDFVSFTIEQILVESGIQRLRDIAISIIIPQHHQEEAEKLSSTTHQQEQEESHEQLSSEWRKWENFYNKYLQYQGNWIEETRGTLMVVATVIATMTFQSTLSPPGGVWQENTRNGGNSCKSYGVCEAGTTVLGYAWSEDYLTFMFFNTISFFASLCVVLILISGFPLKNKVVVWVLTIDMTIAVTFMLLTYMWALGLVAPNHIYYRFYKLGYVLGGFWCFILLAIALIQIARLTFWIKKRNIIREIRSKYIVHRAPPNNIVTQTTMEVLGADSNVQDNAMRELYEASIKGCVITLKTLIQRNPLILFRVSLYPFHETPLHIASLLGHQDFCKVLLENNPAFAGEANSEGRCPLHLASAKGHAEVVKILLQIDQESCMVRDKDDMIPLHFAAMRGHVAVIEELVRAKPESIKERIVSDDSTVLHLCVRFNHLEALKFLVETIRLEATEDSNQILCSKDKDGNTVLHLAVKHSQFKMIEYLVSVPEMSPAISGLNGVSGSFSSALEMQHSISALVIHQPLIRAGARPESSSNTLIAQESAPQASSDQGPSSTHGNNNAQIAHSSSSPDTGAEQPQHLASMDQGQAQPQLRRDHPSQSSEPHPPPTPPPQEDDNNSIWNSSRIELFFKTYLISQINWMDSSQLMVATTVIATITFQSVLSPPGGVWSEDTHGGGYQCNTFGYCEAGTAVLGYAQYPDYMKFIFFNSASFFSSLCALLLIISGFPLNNIVMKWIMTFLMVAAASCMLLTYMWALGMTSPDHIFHRIRSLGYLLAASWGFLLLIIGIFQVIRFIFWLRSRNSSSTPSTTTAHQDQVITTNAPSI